MKRVTLAGGLGTGFSAEAVLRPKRLMEPILWQSGQASRMVWPQANLGPQPHTHGR